MVGRKEKFVGTQALCHSLKSLQSALKYPTTKGLIMSACPEILYNVSPNLMLMSQAEAELWTENPIEFVRLQVDQSNQYNTKFTML